MNIFDETNFPSYFNFIDSVKDTDIVTGSYTEKHHILPKSLNGKDSLDNYLTLSYSDHILAHYYL